MSRSTAFVANTNATAAAMNLLRSDALGASRLLVHQQASPGMTVAVEAGIFFLGGLKVAYAGGNTGTFTAPATNPRIDLVSIDSGGTLHTTTGTENASPVAPAYPYAQMVVAEITHRVGETTILDNENQTAGQGFCTDVRPIFAGPSIAQGVDMTSTYALNTGYSNTTSRPQLHTITAVLTSSSGSNPFIIWQAGANNGQVYFSEGAASTSQIKSTFTLLVPPGGTFSVGTGGVGGSISIQYWYQMDL